MIIPIARCLPLPPRVLRLANTTPIIVSSKTAQGVAVRRYCSTFNALNPSVPLDSSCLYKSSQLRCSQSIFQIFIPSQFFRFKAHIQYQCVKPITRFTHTVYSSFQHIQQSPFFFSGIPLNGTGPKIINYFIISYPVEKK